MRIIALLVLAGCQKDLVADLPDAGNDAGIDALAPACPIPSQPLAPGQHKIFLNTEGVTLIHCSADDAITNCSTVIAADTIVPPFLDGTPGRTDAIAQIVAMTQAKLAPYSVDIVTTRPTSGDYQMVALGGTGPTNVDSVTGLSCRFLPRGVDLMYDIGVADGTLAYMDTMLDDLGLMMGLAPASLPMDCMCRFDAPCGTVAQDCTFGVSVPTTMDTSLDCGTTTQDETALIKAAVGCR